MKAGRIDGRAVLGVLMTAGLALGGCAGNKDYDNLVDSNRSLTEQLAASERANQELQAENSLLQRNRAAADAAVAELRRSNEELRAKLGLSEDALNEFNTRLANATLGPLDAQTDAALAALARQHPDLIKYDAARGMLRFASDLTFDSGQDAVKEEARQSLAALATILNSTSAAAYEVMILGHTDSQPISSGTAARHPTNMHLSCHRAIAVRRSLVEQSVPADRVMAAGWGEHRPAVPNAANGNTPANRRVEIYLTRPSSASLGDAEPTPGAAGPVQPEIIK